MKDIDIRHIQQTVFLLFQTMSQKGDGSYSPSNMIHMRRDYIESFDLWSDEILRITMTSGRQYHVKSSLSDFIKAMEKDNPT